MTGDTDSWIVVLLLGSPGHSAAIGFSSNIRNQFGHQNQKQNFKFQALFVGIYI